MEFDSYVNFKHVVEAQDVCSVGEQVYEFSTYEFNNATHLRPDYCVSSIDENFFNPNNTRLSLSFESIDVTSDLDELLNMIVSVNGAVFAPPPPQTNGRMLQDNTPVAPPPQSPPPLPPRLPPIDNITIICFNDCAMANNGISVSYTHLTLPTICSV